MDAYEHIQKAETLAHAYLVRGGSMGGVIKALEARGVVTRGNPDFYAVTSESLVVDDVRAIAAFASLAPLADAKYVSIDTKSATEEAQNALLKIFEEGTGHSHFFLVIEPGARVLPTLISRCVVLHSELRTQNSELAQDFLALSYKDRLLLSEKFAKNHDREGARQLVRSLLAIADEQKFDATILRDLLDADKYLALSGSSPKGVIGHLALVL